MGVRIRRNAQLFTGKLFLSKGDYMPRSKNKLGEVILTPEARAQLSGDEICNALARHRPKDGVSTFRSEGGLEILVVTEDERTRVMLPKP